jgi:hypothetical protein
MGSITILYVEQMFAARNDDKTLAPTTGGKNKV